MHWFLVSIIISCFAVSTLACEWRPTITTAFGSSHFTIRWDQFNCGVAPTRYMVNVAHRGEVLFVSKTGTTTVDLTDILPCTTYDINICVVDGPCAATQTVTTTCQTSNSFKSLRDDTSSDSLNSSPSSSDSADDSTPTSTSSANDITTTGDSPTTGASNSSTSGTYDVTTSGQYSTSGGYAPTTSSTTGSDSTTGNDNSTNSSSSSSSDTASSDDASSNSTSSDSASSNSTSSDSNYNSTSSDSNSDSSYNSTSSDSNYNSTSSDSLSSDSSDNSTSSEDTNSDSSFNSTSSDSTSSDSSYNSTSSDSASSNSTSSDSTSYDSSSDSSYNTTSSDSASDGTTTGDADLTSTGGSINPNITTSGGDLTSGGVESSSTTGNDTISSSSSSTSGGFVGTTTGTTSTKLKLELAMTGNSSDLDLNTFKAAVARTLAVPRDNVFVEKIETPGPRDPSSYTKRTDALPPARAERAADASSSSFLLRATIVYATLLENPSVVVDTAFNSTSTTFVAELFKTLNFTVVSINYTIEAVVTTTTMGVQITPVTDGGGGKSGDIRNPTTSSTSSGSHANNQPMKTKSLAIPVGITVPAVVLVAAVSVTFYVRYHRNRRATHRAEHWNMRNMYSGVSPSSIDVIDEIA